MSSISYQAEERAADVLVIPNASMTGYPGAGRRRAASRIRKDHADRLQGAGIPRRHRAAGFAGGSGRRGRRRPTTRSSQEYEAQKAAFSTPDIREIEQVVVQDQAQADKIEEAVKAGTAFADAVKQVTGGDPVVLGKLQKQACRRRSPTRSSPSRPAASPSR